MSRVLLCGGGSGGHVLPALALSDALRRHPRVERVALVGTRRGLEARLAPRAGLEFFPIHVRHFDLSPLGRARALVELGLGLAESLRLLRRFRPSLVLGTGGYAAFPPLVAGRVLGIPTALLEPNAVLGRVNRLLAPWVDRVFFAWPEALAGLDLPGACRSGVPLRAGIGSRKRSEALYRRWGLEPHRKTLLVLGGSLGARPLCRLAGWAAEALEGWQVLLVLGTRQDRARVPRRPRLRAVPFVERMDEVLALADAAVTRAGAVTLAELAAAGVPALIVPWEGAAGGHQLANARCAVRAGTGTLLREGDLNPTTALAALARLLAPAHLASSHCLSFALGRLHRRARERIVKEVEPYLEGHVSLRRYRRRRYERLGQGLLAAVPSLARLEHRGQPPHV